MLRAEISCNSSHSKAVNPPVDAMAALDDLLPLIGDRVFVVQPRRSSDTEGGGGDVDMVVSGLDPSWPLRLPTGWRLCQVLHYDIKGWYWVLDHDGETIALDTVDDPEGLGRDGIPTDRLIELAERHPETGEGRIPDGQAGPQGAERLRRLDAYRRACSCRDRGIRAGVVMDLRGPRCFVADIR